jgi:predicted phosphate transport protein (TIGR00153 family)
MRTIAKLFGRSPFIALRAHMDKVTDCVHQVPLAIEACFGGQRERLDELAKHISELEHQADIVKNDIRNHLRKSIFLPVDRANLLDMLGVQDNIADAAENIAVLLTLKPLPMLEAFRGDFQAFLTKNIETFDATQGVIAELDRLLESGFGGNEAEHVKSLVEDVAFKEHESDLIQRTLLRSLLAHEDELSKGEFYLWLRILRQVSTLSDLSEKLANRVRMTLELK